ncbi:hypothetical protein AB3Y40_20375 [Yoonia sp. R2331]
MYFNDLDGKQFLASADSTNLLYQKDEQMTDRSNEVFGRTSLGV